MTIIYGTNINSHFFFYINLIFPKLKASRKKKQLHIFNCRYYKKLFTRYCNKVILRTVHVTEIAKKRVFTVCVCVVCKTREFVILYNIGSYVFTLSSCQNVHTVQVLVVFFWISVNVCLGHDENRCLSPCVSYLL